MSPLSLLLVLFAVTCEAFVGPAVAQTAISRSVVNINSSPVMFGARKNAAPKKVVKKVAKKAPKKVVKKVAKSNVAPAASAATKFFSKENWAYQAFDLLKKL